MAEDPLFDPWTTAAPDEESVEEPTLLGPPPPMPVEKGEAPRWRSVARPRDLPGSPPEPAAASVRQDSRPARPSPPARSVRERPGPIGPPAPTPTGRSAPVRPKAHPLASRLQDLALPELEALVARLEVARHRTLVDDRLEGPDARLRFRLIPRRGPFDERGAVQASALELAVDENEVVARLWLDALADAPTEEIRVDGSRLARPWVDRVLIDFVERALRRG